MTAAHPATRPGRLPKAELLRRFLAAAAVALLTVFAGWAALLRAGGSLLTLSYDMPFVFHRAGAADDLRIVYLDEFKNGMLNRDGQAVLLDKLGELGATAVIYDIFFTEPWKDPKVDEGFAAAMRRFRGVDASGNPLPGVPRRTILLACERQSIDQAGVRGEQLIPPIEQLLDAADDFGIVAFLYDDSYTIRELSTGTTDEASITWKLATALGTKLDENTRLDQRWINYAGPPPDPDDPDAVAAFRACSARDVDGVAPGFFRNKVVIIGGKPGVAGAAAGIDLFSTPFHRFHRRGNLPLMSGVEIQANALSNLVQRNWLTRSSDNFDLLLVIIVGALTGAGMTRVRPVHGLIAAFALVVIFTLAGAFAVHYGNVWFPWSVVALVEVPVALVLGIAAHYYIERFVRLKLTEEQRHLREAFAKYLSPQMLDRLTEEGFEVKVGGIKVQVVMMFTDLESFTTMCQRVRDPEKIVDTLNDYFQRTTGHIFDHDGVIIQFIGDAIFAAWGAPLADPEAPRKAIRAAWRLFESDKLVVDGQPLRTRMGVHFGEVVAGNIGSDRHIDYGLIGDPVNVTSRLEGLNKLLGTCILISDSVQKLMSADFRTRRIGRFLLKGCEEVTVVYELIGPTRQEQEPAWITDYHQALAALEVNDHDKAHALFSSTDSRRGRDGDGPSKFFLDVLAKGELLPGGVVEMKEK